MLDLIPAQQPIKNQHQILWCGYQHVITSRPITALVSMRCPAFFCLGVITCSGTDKTRRKKRASLVWIGPSSLNCNTSRSYINPWNILVNLNTITELLYLLIKARLLSSRIHVQLVDSPPATATGHHPSGGSLPRRQHEVARRPRTTVCDLLRVQYTIPVPTTISEVYTLILILEYTLIRTIATQMHDEFMQFDMEMTFMETLRGDLHFKSFK